jgi:hypothetical protein
LTTEELHLQKVLTSCKSYVMPFHLYSIYNR